MVAAFGSVPLKAYLANSSKNTLTHKILLHPIFFLAGPGASELLHAHAQIIFVRDGAAVANRISSLPQVGPWFHFVAVLYQLYLTILHNTCIVRYKQYSDYYYNTIIVFVTLHFTLLKSLSIVFPRIVFIIIVVILEFCVCKLYPVFDPISVESGRASTVLPAYISLDIISPQCTAAILSSVCCAVASDIISHIPEDKGGAQHKL